MFNVGAGMPVYHYECKEGHKEDLWCTIAEMEEFEGNGPRCVICDGDLIRDLRTRRHLLFREGFYEHISENGAYISSMSELKRIAKDNGNYSEYAEDFGGAFGAKEGRWI